MILIDSHAHLELEPLSNDPSAVVERARAAGVVAVVTVGIDTKDAQNALRIAEEFEDVFASVGFHPHNAKDVENLDLSDMEHLAEHPKVVAYGEIGLDYFRNHSPQTVQISVFQEQLQLAKRLGKPVVIHLRDAYDDGLHMIEQAGPFPEGGVIHCFSGNREQAERALGLGFHISVPGTVTYKKNDELRSIVADLPEDRILLETDCPFLAPEPKRGKVNEPALITHTAQTVAQVRGVPVEQIAYTTTCNAVKFFKLPIELPTA
jgi:TatD DNase family protein